MTVVGAAVVASLATGLVLTRIPAVTQQLILYEHRHLPLSFSPVFYHSGFGWASDEQFQDRQLGRLLLGDRKLVEHRLQQLAQSPIPAYQIADQWALMYAAQRLQGKGFQEILESEHGLTLTLATLVAEADPPRSWGSMSWLQDKLELRPQGSFRMGLLEPDEVSQLLSKLSDYDYPHVACLVRAVLRHDDRFTPQQREQVLQAWYDVQGQRYDAFSHNSQASLQRALLARQTVREKLAPYNRDGRLSYRLIFPESWSPQERGSLSQLWGDFLRACGYSPQPGDENSPLSFEFALEPQTFLETELDHFRTYTTSEWALRRTTTDPNRSLTGRGGYTRRELEVVETTERVSELGAAEIVSLVVTAQFGEQTMVLALPPFGEARRDTQERIAAALEPANLSRDQFTSRRFYLHHEASRPWRFGLQQLSP